jgi:hypothetical protein
MSHAAVVDGPAYTAARFLLFPPLGALVHAVAMAAGYGYDLGYAVLALAGVLVAAAAAVWSCVGSPRRLEQGAAIVAAAAALALPAWWSGWPLVLGATAAGLALEHQRRFGSWSRWTQAAGAVGMGVLVVGTSLCVVG